MNTRVFTMSAGLVSTLTLILALGACEMEAGRAVTGVRFSQAGWVPDDVVGPLPSAGWDVGRHERPAHVDAGGTMIADTGGGAELGLPPVVEEGYLEVPVVTGLLSSYSRGSHNPSIRQWYDRARTLGVRALVFSDLQYRTESAHPFYQFSDANPDVALQHVFRFDFAFVESLFRTQGEGAEARLVTKQDEPRLTFDPGISLRSVPGGSAEASYTHPGGFDYDLQDVNIMLRVKVVEKSGDGRALFRVTYGIAQNTRTFTWVLSWVGEPGEGIAAGFNTGANFHTFHLPLKQLIIEEMGEAMWREGALQAVELRTEGHMWAIYDHIRLQVDAWFDTYVEETRRYSDSQVRFLPGVEHSFSAPLGQFNCVAPELFPASTKSVDDGLMEDFAQAGCFAVANRPLMAGSLISEDRAIRAGAIEVWHPAFRSYEGNIDTDWWDGLLLARGRFPALASAAPSSVEGLSARSPHNVVLVEELSDEAILEAISKGRSYMVDDMALRADFWIEDRLGERVPIGGESASPHRVHVAVDCDGPVASARLRRVKTLTGEASNVPLVGVESGLVMDIEDWHGCFVRLEASCENGARLYTNPIFLR